MARVVLHVEADARDRQPEQGRQGQGLPPGLRNEHQQRVAGREAGEDDGRLEVHLRAVALPPASIAQVLFDPPADLLLEAGVAGELNPPAPPFL